MVEFPKRPSVDSAGLTNWPPCSWPASNRGRHLHSRPARVRGIRLGKTQGPRHVIPPSTGLRAADTSSRGGAPGGSASLEWDEADRQAGNGMPRRDYSCLVRVVSR